MDPQENNRSDDDSTTAPASPSTANLTVMLDGAVTAFQQHWGQKVRAHRQQVAALGMPPGFDVLLQTLPQMGIALSPEEIRRIEEGTFTNLDIRLLLAVCLVLEVGVDDALFAALREGASQHTGK